MSSTRTSGIGADARALHRSLLELKRVIQFRDRDQICCHDISVTQCWALETLRRRGALTLNELAAELLLEKSTASRTVSALERKGYISRGRHPGDGRAITLELAPSGEALYSRIEKEMLAEEASILEEFEPHVRTAVISAIERLAAAGAERVSAAGGTCCRIAPESGRNPKAGPECC